METILLFLCIIIIIAFIIICLYLIKFNVIINKTFEETIKIKKDIAELKDTTERYSNRNYTKTEYIKQTIEEIINKYMPKFIARQEVIFTKVIDTDKYLREYLDDLKAHRQRKRQKMNNSSIDK